MAPLPYGSKWHIGGMSGYRFFCAVGGMGLSVSAVGVLRFPS